MMALKSKSIVGLGIFCLLGSACADDASSGETESGASSDSDTTAAMTTAMTTMSMDTGTTASMDTGTGTTASVDTGTGTTASVDTGSSGSSDSGTTAGSESSDSGTTGGAGNCVDEDIGMAVGEAVASGSTMGQGDDFDWESCGGIDTGGFVDSGVAFIGPGDSGVGGVDDGGDMGNAPGKNPGDLGGKGPGDDYVVSWTAPATATYALSLEGSSYDTFLSVHDPMCGSEPNDCNDDCFDLESGLGLSANMGQTYFIVIDGFAGRVGNFTLSIQEEELECSFGETDTFGETDSFGESGVGFIDPSATSGVGSFSTSG